MKARAPSRPTERLCILPFVAPTPSILALPKYGSLPVLMRRGERLWLASFPMIHFRPMLTQRCRPMENGSTSFPICQADMEEQTYGALESMLPTLAR